MLFTASRYILSNSAGGKFSMHPVTGMISTTTMLDQEEQHMYTLVAQATDQGSLPLTSSAVVTVVVDDENDNTPQFMQSQYHSHLRDSTSSGKFTFLQFVELSSLLLLFFLSLCQKAVIQVFHLYTIVQ